MATDIKRISDSLKQYDFELANEITRRIKRHQPEPDVDLQVLEQFVSNNPPGRNNPIYRHLAVQNKKQMLEKYGINFQSELAAEIKALNNQTSEVFQAQNMRDLCKEELELYKKVTKLMSFERVLSDDVPLTDVEVSTALAKMQEYSSVLKLPKSLIENSNDAFEYMIHNGIPKRHEVDDKIQSLNQALQHLVSVVNFDRFDEITFDALKSRVTRQNWMNYFRRLKSKLSGSTDHIEINDIVVPDDSNYLDFVKLVELYIQVDPEEKNELHEFSTIENSLKSKNYIEIYKALFDNSQFLNYIVNGIDDFKVIQAYVLYSTLKEINYIQQS